MRTACLALASLALLAATTRASAPPATAVPPAAAVAAGGDVESRARALVADLAAGRFAAATADFDAKMLSALPAPKLAEFWNGLVGQAGEFQAIEGAKKADAPPPYHGVVLDARFARAQILVSVFFDGAGKVAGLFFKPNREKLSGVWAPPDYGDVNRFDEREVTVESGAWKLPGTLAVPKGPGPFPAVVLVHGSGPQDRDESIGANKPFKDLAWGLASRGLAVLRYEKRTWSDGARVQREGVPTVRQETTDDALAAVALLRRTPGIDPARIYVAGHSLGGMLVPRIGMADRAIAGFVVLAGNARPLEDVILEQETHRAEADGKTTADETRGLAEAKRQVARLKDPALGPSTPASELFGAPASYWLDLRGYRPAEVARGLHRPILVLQGERDIQVSMVDFGEWKKALQGDRQARFKAYPALNHLFIAGQGPGTIAEYQRPGHVSREVVEDVARFVLAPARSPAVGR
ncbi:MAG TPA: alpha/beta fold hydrolase [Thermoanaerobaculia bacterium]|jgi:hypothetical protein